MTQANTALREAKLVGYIISKEGVLRNPEGGIVNGFVKTMGYRFFSIRMNGKIVGVSFHRLQAYEKYGDIIFFEGVEVRHYNGIRSDNSWNNILVGTHSINMLDVSPEERLKKANHATSFMRKHNKGAVKAYFEIHGFKNAMEHFNISSKGTMSYIINH